MPQILCRYCSVLIPADDVNVAEGVALCRACDRLSRLEDIVDRAADQDEISNNDIGNPPVGCVVHDDGIEFRISASARSIPRAFGALFAAAFWNGIVSIFVLNAAAGVLHHLLGAVPTWFPAPIGGSGSSMSLGMVIFLCVFLIPFVGIGLMLASTCLTCFFGCCEVTVRGSEGRIFTGVNPLGWRRKFDASAVRSVQLGQTRWSQDEQTQPCIVLETGAKDHRLASVLRRDRREWMAAVLRSLLVK